MGVNYNIKETKGVKENNFSDKNRPPFNPKRQVHRNQDIYYVDKTLVKNHGIQLSIYTVSCS